jgi:hypothetical protein
MELFGTRVVAAILPFDAHHTFARYLSIVESAVAPEDTMYVATPENIQTRYPTAFGLYMALLAQVSSGTVIPLPELEGALACEIDKAFSKNSESPFFAASNPADTREAPAVGASSTITHGSGNADSSFFVAPFYFADLPLFCLVVNFAGALPITTTDQNVYSSVLQNVAHLVRQELRASFECHLLRPFYDAAVGRLAAERKLSGPDSARLLDQVMQQAQNKKWKSWLMTVPSRRIRGLALVEEERQELSRAWERARRDALSDALARISNWFGAGRFFENEGDVQKDTKKGHDEFNEELHTGRLREMLHLAGDLGSPNDLMNCNYFGSSEGIQHELRWLVSQLSILVSSGSFHNKDLAFQELKSVFCRAEANKSERFKFSPRRIRALCRMYHPDSEVLEPDMADPLKPIPMGDDYTLHIIKVVRQFRENTIARMSLTHQETESPDIDSERQSRWLEFAFSLQIQMREAFNPGGGQGADYEALKRSLFDVGFDRDCSVPTFSCIKLQFGVMAELGKKDGGVRSLKWKHDTDGRIAEVNFV